MGFGLTHYWDKIEFIPLFLLPAAAVTLTIVIQLFYAGIAPCGKLTVYKCLTTEIVTFLNVQLYSRFVERHHTFDVWWIIHKYYIL